jgi:hypothetical protein
VARAAPAAERQPAAVGELQFDLPLREQGGQLLLRRHIALALVAIDQPARGVLQQQRVDRQRRLPGRGDARQRAAAHRAQGVVRAGQQRGQAAGGGLPARMQVRAAGQRTRDHEDRAAAQQRRQHQQAQAPAGPAARPLAHERLLEAAGVEGAVERRIGRAGHRRSGGQPPGRHTSPCLLASTAASARLETLSFL